MTKTYVVISIDLDCDCCSYVPVASFDSMEDIPLVFLGANYEIEMQDD